MKNIAIIAEYNPLHNGHIYHMNKVREDNNVIVALSGNFTERGDVAVLNKYHRAKLAVEHGADMVIEIPTFGVLSCGENYAKCAINTLSLLNNVDEVSFGSETGDIDTLRDIAMLEESEAVKASMQKLLKDGMSYPKALSNAIASNSNIHNIEDIMSKPNNILGIEYIRACKDKNIIPTTIARVGNDYNDDRLSDSDYASATSIRNNIDNDNIEKYLPSNVLDAVRNNSTHENALFHSLYQKLVVSEDDIANILNIGEGIDNRIREMLKYTSSYKELLASIKTKRYTLSRIKRTLLDILLGIDKSMTSSINTIDYVTVLAVRRDKLNLLSQASANIITKYNDYRKTSHPFASLDLKANKLYNMVSSDKIDSHQMLIID